MLNPLLQNPAGTGRRGLTGPLRAARSSLALALCTAFALQALPVSADEPAAGAAAAAPASDAARLDAVTVTARRREESLRDVPVAVTAMGVEALETMNVRNFADLQGLVPSLSIYAARGSNTTLTTYIRGVGQSDPLWGVDPGVGIYLDDVYIARPQGALLEVFDTERIEVLRGPQGTLYGKNTIGGAVKYVSRPLAKKTEGALTLELGERGQRNVKAALGSASDDGQWRGRVSLASLKRGGFGKNLADGSDVSNQDTRAARISAGFFPSGSPLSVQLSADDTRDNSNMRGFQRLAANPFDPLKTPPLDSRYDINSGMANANHTNSGGHALMAGWKLNEAWQARFIHAYRKSDTATAIDFDGLPPKIADVLADYADHSTSNELQLSFDGGDSSGVIGLYLFDGQAGGRVRNNFFDKAFGTTAGTVYTKSTAGYADWNWRLTPRLGLNLGLRYTHESKRAVVLNQAFSDASFSKPLLTSSNFDQSLVAKNWAPKLALDFKLSANHTVYGSATRGFKSGGYNVRANVLAVPESAKPIADETIDAFELGLKSVLDEGRLEVNTAIFHNAYRNVQLSVFTSYRRPDGTPDFFSDFTNAGRARVEGVETEMLWRPARGWTLSGNLALLNAKYTEYMDRGVNVAAQKKFSNTPELQAAFNIEQRSQPSFGGTLRSRVGVSYRSKVYPTTDLSEAIAQGGFSLLNAGVIWERDSHWSFGLQGSNLGNKAYRTDGYNIATLGVLTGFYGPPRQLTASASYRF
ncbi:TonB-dependent receptor [Paucibacter sp. APW11]|uniref:TonB-dependent receptor n=1 Tax=Roseateles aquae TaxID=3077235 RepID=A0ABU3PEW6_9BURK|nr:TonB-dependent receptor [Paucibacter sp. APW11]MDT9000643.1 TonB-dependent receptor [Paucibacter sp. APW11]